MGKYFAIKVKLGFSHDPFPHHDMSLTDGLCLPLGRKACEDLGVPEEPWVTPMTLFHEPQSSRHLETLGTSVADDDGLASFLD